MSTDEFEDDEAFDDEEISLDTLEDEDDGEDDNDDEFEIEGDLAAADEVLVDVIGADDEDEEEDKKKKADEDTDTDADEDEVEELDDEEDDEGEESLDVLLAREKVLDDDDLGRLGDDNRGAANAAGPIGAGEFTCRSCFLVKKRAQLADPERLICLDCA